MGNKEKPWFENKNESNEIKEEIIERLEDEVEKKSMKIEPPQPLKKIPRIGQKEN